MEYMSSNHNISEEKRQTIAIKWNEMAAKLGNMPNKTIIEAFDQLTKKPGFSECKDIETELEKEKRAGNGPH